MPLDTHISEATVCAEWQALIERTTKPAHEALAAIARSDTEALADDFYDHMLSDTQASMFLSSEQVQTRLHASLQRWLVQVLCAAQHDLQTLVSAQHSVGEVHARIGMPVSLVAHAARRIKRRLFQRIEHSVPDIAVRIDAIRYVALALDLALEVMTAAYSRSREKSAKSDEAYRLFSVLQNVGAERERQRAALLDWENDFVYKIATGGALGDAQTLSASDFGLWFHHKGLPIFGQGEDVDQLTSLIARTDALLRGAQQGDDTPVSRLSLLRSVRERASEIRFLLGALFERINELESGRDALTQLLNRRFIPTVLRREVSMATRARSTFALAMIDIDHFKAVNDNHGHEVGDLALQQVASVLQEAIRGSDYAFRYGGEEFLLVLVEASESQAAIIADRVRRQVESHPVTAPQGQTLRLTVSIGLALHTGHPDYSRTIADADEALYRAKRNGRNRVEIKR